ncbi:MAG TPA: TIGR03435 family protein [Bryobacteraceae bacterium]|nr:TIGR03435 family protein [Bryobacteraceae bacterium]
MIFRRILIVLAFCAAAGLWGQNFETASVKRSARGVESDVLAPPQNGGRIDYRGVTLKSVLAFAYGVTPGQITGPKWLGDERFDIEATLPAGSSPAQIPVMLQHLLADRFAMKAHEEDKTISFFALVPAKGGVKMKNVEKPEISATVDLMSDNIQLRGYTMPAFARFLSNSMGHPVVDETNLTGTYDITLYLSMADIKTARIRVAIQQLGLQFENRKGPVKSLVVDSVNQAPTGD